MNPMTILLVADGLVTLALRIYGGIKDDPTTPEEAKARAELAFTRLGQAKDAMDAYQPIPPPA